MLTLQHLDDEEYLSANDISTEEAEIFKAEIMSNIDKYKSEINGCLNYISERRQEMYASYIGWKTEIERLTKLADSYERKVKNMDKWIDIVLKQYGIDKINTSLYAISYRTSTSVDITNEELLPKEFIKEKTTYTPDKIAIKEAIKKGNEVPGAEITTHKNIQIK